MIIKGPTTLTAAEIGQREAKMVYGIRVEEGEKWYCVDSYVHPLGYADIHITPYKVTIRLRINATGPKRHLIKWKTDKKSTLEEIRKDVLETVVPKLLHIFNRYMGDSKIPLLGSTDLA